MTERQLLTKFSKDIKAAFGKDLFWYKIPDIPMSSVKKPFDVFAVYKGKPYCFEFKAFGGVVLPHQKDYLRAAFIAGARVEYIEFFPTNNTQRNFYLCAQPFFYNKGYDFSNFFEVVNNG